MNKYKGTIVEKYKNNIEIDFRYRGNFSESKSSLYYTYFLCLIL